MCAEHAGRFPGEVHQYDSSMILKSDVSVLNEPYKGKISLKLLTTGNHL